MSFLLHPRRGIALLPLLPALALGLGMVPVTAGTSFGVGQASHAGMSTGPTADAPEPIVVRPTQLPRGPASKVRWLFENIVHTGSGRTVKMPWTREGARAHSLRLVGRTADGWLVKSFGGNTWTLWSVRDGKRHPITSSSVSEGEVVNYRLSRNHQRFLVHLFDGDRTTTIYVRDLNNAPVDTQDFAGVGAVLAFSGSELVVNVTDTQRWDVDAQSVDPLGVNAAAADIGHGLLFVSDSATDESGPTSLESPSTPPAWTAEMAQIGVSPGGGRVLSRDTRGEDLLTVYSRVTGAVRVSFSVRFLASEAPIWESNRSFVFIAAVNESETLVRCRINGSCQRISAFRPRDTIQLPPL